jgi:hypothetical protein
VDGIELAFVRVHETCINKQAHGPEGLTALGSLMRGIKGFGDHRAFAAGDVRAAGTAEIEQASHVSTPLRTGEIARYQTTQPQETAPDRWHVDERVAYHDDTLIPHG